MLVCSGTEQGGGTKVSPFTQQLSRPCHGIAQPVRSITRRVTPAELTPTLLTCPLHLQYARGLAQRFPLVTGLQGDRVARVVVRLRPGVHCAVQWHMSHLLCPMGTSIGSIAQVGRCTVWRAKDVVPGRWAGHTIVGAATCAGCAVRPAVAGIRTLLQSSSLQLLCLPFAEGHQHRPGAAARLGCSAADCAAAAARHAAPAGSFGCRTAAAVPLGAQRGCGAQVGGVGVC